MTEITASRTLVKSPPELWAECSNAESLARHLTGTFGEIRITRLEPETAVAWEGEQFSGTVRLEPSGWGTKVVMTAAPAGIEAVITEPEPVVEMTPPTEPEPEPAPEPEAELEPRRGFLARLFWFARRPPKPGVELEPPEVVEPEVLAEPQSPPSPSPAAEAELAAALESLGQAHHRPFSRG